MVNLSIMSETFQHLVAPDSTWVPFSTQFYPDIVSALSIGVKDYHDLEFSTISYLKYIRPGVIDIIWLYVVGRVTPKIICSRCILLEDGRNKLGSRP